MLNLPVETFDYMTYILYTLITSTAIYTLVLLTVNTFGIEHPQYKAWLLMLPLLLPLSGYLFLCRVPAGGCSQGAVPWFNLEGMLCSLRSGLNSYWGTVFWLFITFGLIRLGMRVLIYSFLIRRCEPIGPEEASVLHRIMGELVVEAGIAFPPLYWARGSRYPVCFAFGFRGPRIAISEELVENLEPAELRAVLAHEIGHLSARDFISGWILVICRDLMAFNPIGYLSYRSFLWEREKACDDYAISITGQPLVLAECLVKLGRMMRQAVTVGWRQPEVAILGIHQDSLLSQRVRRLIQPSRPRAKSWHYSLTVLLTVVILQMMASAC